MRRRFFTGKIRTQIFYQKKTCRSNYRQEISSFSHKPPVVQMRRKKTPEWVLGSGFWVLGYDNGERQQRRQRLSADFADYQSGTRPNGLPAAGR